MTQERPDALFVIADPLVSLNQKRIVEFAAQSRLPAMYEVKSFADAGGLMAYGPSRSDALRHGAAFVDKILKGAKPADLPVEQPTRFELVVNLKTAKALGLAIPQSVLIRADHVIR
jgi:putative ABC transport system substrate-binding protein